MYRKGGFVWTIPVLLLAALIGWTMAGHAIFLSLHKAGPHYSEWVGLYNFRYLLRQRAFFMALRNTITYVIITVPLTIAIAAPTAFALTRMRRATTVATIFYLPQLVTPVIMATVYQWILSGRGLANSLLILMGVQPVGWLTRNPVAILTISAINVTSGLGFFIIVYMAALTQIPKSLLEEAEVAGATSFQTFFVIVFPILLGLTGYLLLIKTISSFGIFGLISYLTQGGPDYGTITLPFLIFRQTIHQGDFGLASATGTASGLVLAPLLALQVSVTVSKHRGTLE